MRLGLRACAQALLFSLVPIVAGNCAALYAASEQ